MKDNTAHHNLGFGIMAGESVDPGSEPSPTANIDGGGNVASGNAEPEQCVGVVCGTGDAPAAQPAGSRGAGDHDPQRAGQPDLSHGAPCSSSRPTTGRQARR